MGDQLVDARSVVDLRGQDGASFIGMSCLIPDNRPLWEILKEVADHQTEYPTHGTDCTCMDKYVWLIRAQMHRVYDKDMSWDAPGANEQRKASYRVAFVMSRAARR